MKKLLIPALLAALIVGCSSTPVDETSGAPVDSRGSGVAPVTAVRLEVTGKFEKPFCKGFASTANA